MSNAKYPPEKDWASQYRVGWRKIHNVTYAPLGRQCLGANVWANVRLLLHWDCCKHLHLTLVIN